MTDFDSVKKDSREDSAGEKGELVELILKVPEDLYRAYQRCSWIITHESGRDQLEVMEEMVLDYLIKHEC